MFGETHITSGPVWSRMAGLIERTSCCAVAWRVAIDCPAYLSYHFDLKPRDLAMTDELSAYDYHLPDELIARQPPPRRDAARLMVVRRATASIEHAVISDLPNLLQPGDCLVLNDSRVLPARLLGHRTATGGQWEGLYLGQINMGDWKLICRTRGKLVPGEQITIVRAHAAAFEETLLLTLLAHIGDGVWQARAATDLDPQAALERFGTVPLPPYLGRELATPDDFVRYQTVYAQRPGSVAAPTAGLHFTPELFAACDHRKIARTFVTLHVGIGTFRPISAARLTEHVMHAEWCEISADAAKRLRETRDRLGRVVAIGTTAARTLETAAGGGQLEAWRGETRIFIRPPHHFRGLDCLVTNFHLPRSSLLVLVAAFAGQELMQRAYALAVERRYRFFSYGDAMLIL